MNNIDQYIARAWPKWFVGFNDDGSRDYWTDHLSPEGFQHCFAFAFDPDADRWLVFETNRSGSVFLVMTEDAMLVWLEIQKSVFKMRVLEVTSNASYSRNALTAGMWCVVAVKHLVGSNSRALRPIGLWRDLLRAGAREAFASESEFQPW